MPIPEHILRLVELEEKYSATLCHNSARVFPNFKPKTKVGVMGYSSQNFNKDMAEAYLSSMFTALGKDIVVVSGLSNIGVPAIAYKLAKENDLLTVGVASKQVEFSECFPVDVRMIVGEKHGDESKAFVDMCSVFIKVGGGEQSENEAKMAREAGKEVFELPLPTL